MIKGSVEEPRTVEVQAAPHYFIWNQKKLLKTEGIIMLVREQMTFPNAAESRSHNSKDITLPRRKKFSIKAQGDFRN